MRRFIEFRKTTVYLPAILASLFLLLPAIRAGAEPVRIDLLPSLRLQEEWKSNVLNTAEGEVSSFATRVNPSLGVRMTSSDNVSVLLTGNYEKVWHHNTKAKGADFNTWNIRVDSTGQWAFSPNLTVTPSVYFINTEESSRRASFLPMDDQILSPMSAVTYSSTKRQSSGAALDFIYRISSVWDAGLRLNYSQERFKDKGSGSANDLTNSSQAGVRASLSYAISPLSKAGLFAQASFIEFSNSPNSQVYSLGATYNHRVSPFLQFFLDAGASYIVTNKESDSGGNKIGPTGSIRLQYDRDAFRATLFGATMYSGGSGYGSATRDYRVGVLLSQKFTETVNGTLSGYYQTSQSVYKKDDMDIDTMRVGATLNYQPWRIASVYLQCAAESQKSHGNFGSTIDSYSAILGISILNLYNIY